MSRDIGKVFSDCQINDIDLADAILHLYFVYIFLINLVIKYSLETINPLRDYRPNNTDFSRD